MEPPARKQVQCHVPKKVYTFKMQQEQKRDEANKEKVTKATDNPATPSVSYVSQVPEQQTTSTSCNQGEKKFPAQGGMDEEEPAEEASSFEERRPKYYRTKSTVSRGKTSKHLNILMSQQKGRSLEFDSGDASTTPPATKNRTSTYEGSKRHRDICIVDADPKRPCDKSHLHKGKERRNSNSDHRPMEQPQDPYEPDNEGKDRSRTMESHVRNQQQVEDKHAMDRHSQERQPKNHSPSRRNSVSKSSSGLSPVSSYKCLDNVPCPDSGSPIRIVDALKREQEMGLDMCNEISSSVDHLQLKAQPAKRGRPAGSTSGRGRVKMEASSGSAGSTPLLGLVERQDCTICGDVAAGFHCGAYVCEACKKFFVRCLKQGVGDKFVCSRNKNCIVNRETRTQCQYCRYQKCVSLGMYKPGSGPGGSKFGAEISHIPCKVCESPSSGYHFGAITCEGCKGFFRRTVKERAGVRYVCSRNGSCNITLNTRNVCKFCRYQKCLQAGMTPDGSRIGRQPNAVKHATMLELQRLQGKPDAGLPVTVKKEVACPVAESHEAVLPDNAQFELIDPSNFPDDLYLTEGEEGKLEGKLKSERQVEVVSAVQPVMADAESRTLYKPLYSDKMHYSRPMEQESKRHFSTSSSSSSSSNSSISRYLGDPHVLAEQSSPPQRAHKQEGKEIAQQYSHVELANMEQLKQVTLRQSPTMEAHTQHLDPRVSVAPASVVNTEVEKKVRNLQYQQMQSLAKLEALNAQQRELDRQAIEEQTKALELKRELNKLAAPLAGPSSTRSISMQNVAQDLMMQQSAQEAVSYSPYQMDTTQQMRECNIVPQLVQKDDAQQIMEHNMAVQAREEAAWQMRTQEIEVHAQEDTMRSMQERQLEAQEEIARQMNARKFVEQEEAARQMRARDVDIEAREAATRQMREHQMSIDAHEDAARQQWELYERPNRGNTKYTTHTPPSTPSISCNDMHPSSMEVHDVARLGSASLSNPDVTLSRPELHALPSASTSLESTQSSMVATSALQSHPQEEATDLSTSDMSRNGRVPVCVDALHKLPAHLQPIVKKVTHASLQLRPILQKGEGCKLIEHDTSMEVMWEMMMAQFGQCAQSVIKFARRIPGFQSFSVPVQINKVQLSMYPIVMAVLATEFNMKTNAYNYFHMTTVERDLIFKVFPVFRVLDSHFIRIGRAIKLKDLDDIEIAFISAIILMTSYMPGEEEESSQPDCEASLVGALQQYCVNKEGANTGRDRYILEQLKEMNQCNAEHQQVILQLSKDNPGLQIPQLFMETFLAV